LSFIVRNGSLFSGTSRSPINHRSESLVMSHDLLESAALSLQLDAHIESHLDAPAFDHRF
jgi:hypothetical protein